MCKTVRNAEPFVLFAAAVLELSELVSHNFCGEGIPFESWDPETLLERLPQGSVASSHVVR